MPALFALGSKLEAKFPSSCKSNYVTLTCNVCNQGQKESLQVLNQLLSVRNMSNP